MWILSRINSLIKETEDAYGKHRPHEGVKACREFIVEDMSRFYLKVVKKRIIGGRNSGGALDAIYKSILTVSKLMNPAIPFITEKLYQDIFRKYEAAESISLSGWPILDTSIIDTRLERRMAICREIISAAANARQSANVKLRWPLGELVLVTTSTEVREAAEELLNIIKDSVNVRSIRIEQEIEKNATAKPVSAKLGPAFKKDARKVYTLIQALTGEQIKTLVSTGEFVLKSDKATFTISPDMVQIIEEAPQGYVCSYINGGAVYLKTEMSQELYAEAMLREVGRRIQIMRKELNLIEKDQVKVNIVAREKFLAHLEGKDKELARGVNAIAVELSTTPKLKGKSKQWDVEKEKVTIILTKSSGSKRS